MLARPESNATGPKFRGKQIARLRRSLFWFIRQVVVRNPRNPVIRTGEQLKLSVGDPRCASELFGPFRRTPRIFDEARRWCEAGQRHIRCRIGRHRHRVDRYVKSATLQLACARQTNNSATNDCCAPLVMLGCGFRRHVSGSPGQRHASTPVSVIVNQEFLVELLRSKDKTGIPVRTKSNSCADYPVPRCFDRRQSY